MSLEDEGEKTPEEGLTEDQELDAILGDPRKKEALIRKMGLGTEDARDSSRNLTYRLLADVSTWAMLADLFPAFLISGSGCVGAQLGGGAWDGKGVVV